jgi:molybdopterin-guanine dinucleotide biosynthesis protein A
MTVVGVAVAGGESRRMGRDKAFLPWGETDLLGHALARLRMVTDDVRILSGAELRYTDRGVPVEVDAAPDLGPLGGLAAALEAAAGEDVLLLGVDLPLVPPALLTRLTELARGFEAVVPVPARGPEPLCALYGPTCREAVQRHVVGGDLKMTAFWPDVRVREVDPTDLGAFGDPGELFLNVNTSADYERAQVLGTLD